LKPYVKNGKKITFIKPISLNKKYSIKGIERGKKDKMLLKISNGVEVRDIDYKNIETDYEIKTFLLEEIIDPSFLLSRSTSIEVLLKYLKTQF